MEIIPLDGSGLAAISYLTLKPINYNKLIT